MEEHAWDYFADVDLTTWKKLFTDELEKFPRHAFKLDEASLNDILIEIHTAVHRLPTTCHGVQALVKSAIILAETLQDPLRPAQLRLLQLEIDIKIKAMGFNKAVLEDTLKQELQEIQRQRKELDMQEKELEARIIREDRENNTFIGNLLEDSLSQLFVTRPTKEGPDGEEKQMSTTNHEGQ